MEVLPWEKEKQWTDLVMPQAMEIIRKNIGQILDVYEASARDDQEKATDLLISTGTGQTACRFRRLSSVNGHRDLTIRTRARYSDETEIDKLQKGGVRWYFYAWTDGLKIREWMIVDVPKLIESGLIERQTEILNKDGTAFIAIPSALLKLRGCLLTSDLDYNVGEERPWYDR